MSNILNDNVNYSIEPDKYLEAINNSANKKNNYNLLHKHFTENITKSFYHKMKLLELIDKNKLNNLSANDIPDIESKIEKSIIAHMLLALRTLKKEDNYGLNNNTSKMVKESLLNNKYDELDEEINICKNKYSHNNSISKLPKESLFNNEYDELEKEITMCKNKYDNINIHNFIVSESSYPAVLLSSNSNIQSKDGPSSLSNKCDDLEREINMYENKMISDSSEYSKVIDSIYRIKNKYKFK